MFLFSFPSKTDCCSPNQTNLPPTAVKMSSTTATMYSKEQTRLGNGSRYINLQGPNGNVFYLMGLAGTWAMECLWTKEEIKVMSQDFMLYRQYEHVLEMFVKYWGHTATLFRNQYEYEAAVEEQGESEDEDGWADCEVCGVLFENEPGCPLICGLCEEDDDE